MKPWCRLFTGVWIHSYAGAVNTRVLSIHNVQCSDQDHKWFYHKYLITKWWCCSFELLQIFGSIIDLKCSTTIFHIFFSKDSSSSLAIVVMDKETKGTINVFGLESASIDLILIHIFIFIQKQQKYNSNKKDIVCTFMAWCFAMRPNSVF